MNWTARSLRCLTFLSTSTMGRHQVSRLKGAAETCNITHVSRGMIMPRSDTADAIAESQASQYQLNSGSSSLCRRECRYQSSVRDIWGATNLGTRTSIIVAKGVRRQHWGSQHTASTSNHPACMILCFKRQPCKCWCTEVLDWTQFWSFRWDVIEFWLFITNFSEILPNSQFQIIP